MHLSIIVAASLNQVIGINNQLPWHLPADLKYFKKLTTGHTILMGRKTYDSIGRPLPNRENVVVTRSKDFQAEGAVIKYSVEEALQYCKDKDQVFVIGGEEIFKQMMDVVHTIYLTVVHTTIANGDAFFSAPDSAFWKKTSSEFHEKDEKNLFDYAFETYERI
ncbi:MAG: dihydrofolate reductase [Chitinophagaceae bacterium]|nr:dihydrofolate reductase [Chitinophagaceae bacterium]